MLLRPELVVEIELDGVQRSTRYPGGVALRFARVVRYRPDKTAAEADTIDAVRALLPRPRPRRSCSRADIGAFRHLHHPRTLRPLPMRTGRRAPYRRVATTGPQEGEMTTAGS